MTDEEQELTIREPVHTPSGDVAASIEREHLQSDKLSTDSIDKLLTNLGEVAENPSDNVGFTEEKSLQEDDLPDITSQEAQETPEECLSDRQFLQESSSEINLMQSENPSSEDINSDVGKKQNLDNQLSDKELQVKILLEENKTDELKEEIHQADDEIESSGQKEYDDAELSATTEEIHRADVSEKSSIENIKLSFDKIISTDIISTDTGGSNLERKFSEILDKEQDLSVIQLLSSGSDEYEIQTPTLVDRHIRELYDQDNAMGTASNTLPSPKKSKWKMFKNFISLGLASSSSKKTKVPPGVIINKNPPAYFTTRITDKSGHPSISTSAQQSMAPQPYMTAPTPNPGRPLYSGSQFKLGLAGPKFKPNNRKHDKDLNWLQNYDRHVIPMEKKDKKQETQNNTS